MYSIVILEVPVRPVLAIWVNGHVSDVCLFELHCIMTGDYHSLAEEFWEILVLAW